MPAPKPSRRVLAVHPSEEDAQRAAFGPAGWMSRASGVAVEHLGQRSPDPGRPWAVTAARTG
jgi:hypothetical protein